MQGIMEALLAHGNEVSVVGAAVMWPLCSGSKALRKLVVSHLRHALKVLEASSRVAGVQVCSRAGRQ